MERRFSVKVLGVDIGGTATKFLIAENSRVLRQWSNATDHNGPTAVLTSIAHTLRECITAEPDIVATGITLPGHCDAEGRATVIPNLPGEWRGVPVAAPITEAARRPVVLLNDARAHGLAEYRFGAAAGSTVTAVLVLGTGVGGALLLNGHVHGGLAGTAGEFGHMVLDPDGPACGCGNTGCLEALVRSDRLVRASQAASMADLCRRATVGDDTALAVIQAAGRWIGLGLANVATALAPDTIVVGGGVAAAGAVLFDPIRREFARRSPLVSANAVRILPSALGPYAGALGAAAAAARSAE